MLLSLRLHSFMARSRLRRGPVFDDKLKNLTRSPGIRQKIKDYRKQFQTQNITQTFSQTLNSSKPKLGKRFKIDEDKLNKHITKLVKSMVKPSQLEPVSDQNDDFKFLNESKSFIHDQSIQTDFEQKFQKELFMKKQTERMLQKQSRKYTNFLPQNKHNQYNQYIQNKTKLKNSRIDSMMNYKRHNEDLQLLIESGFIDQPDNIKMIIDKINPEHLLPFDVEAEDKKVQEEGLVPKEEGKEEELEDNFLEKHLMGNIQGPEQTRDYSKIEEFIDRYQSNTEESKKKVSEDVNLLLKVKQYERDLFLSRYNQINFRFKGRVDFDFFKQYELLSYIKTQSIDPVDLLQMYDINKDKLSRHGLPIITPAVMSRIYTKTSTYRFSENDQNNHINMLNHPTFKALQNSLFREVDKISDELFCDAAWSYAKNHEFERGLLNVKRSSAINGVIFAQTCERIHRLREEDLGLLMRSIVKLNLLSEAEYDGKWGEIVEALEERLPLMKMDYEYESVMEFLTLLPESEKTIGLIGRNLGFFKKYNWETRATLITFSRACSAVINHQEYIDSFENNKVMNIMKEIVSAKAQQIKTIIPVLTINELSKTLVIFHELAKIPFGLQFPQIIMNIAKKQIVSSINTQKHKIYQFTIPTLLTTLSAYDYYNNLVRGSTKYISTEVLTTPYHQNNVLKVVGLRHMLPGRVFTFNSKLYFVYHQLARLVQVEESMMSLKSLTDSLFGLSVVQYRNQGTYDALAFKILERVEKRQHQTKEPRLKVSQVVDLMKVVSAYSLQKRSTDVIQEICDQILENGKTAMKSVQLSHMVRFFGAYINIFAQPTELPDNQGDEYVRRWSRNKNIVFAFIYCFKHYIRPFLGKLEQQERISLYFTQTMILNNLSRIIGQNQQNLSSEFAEAIKQSKQNLRIIIPYILKKEGQALKGDYKYLMSLCLELNSLDMEIGQEYGGLAVFEKSQRQFYDLHIEEILRHEEHIGVSMSYRHIAKRVKDKLENEAQEKGKIIQKPWRVEDIHNKKVYFKATFQHLMTKYHTDETAFALFGLWRIYSQLYRRKGWEFQLICTMLQD